MPHRVSISILVCTISILTAQAQWNKQDSVRLQRLLNEEGELDINTEAVKSIHFDFKPEQHKSENPIMSQHKPWIKFIETLPKTFDDTIQWRKPKFVRLTPYTPYTRWKEDPIYDRIEAVEEKDSLRASQMTWKLNINHMKKPKGIYFSADKLLYESFSKRGRAIRRNRKHARAWKTYKDYIPMKRDTVKKDSLWTTPADSLLLKDKINSKDQTDEGS